MAPVKPVEAIEDSLALGRRDAKAVVLNDQCAALAGGAELHGDRGAGGRLADLRVRLALTP